MRWLEITPEASTSQIPPSARMGHVAVAVDSRQVWGEELVLLHGGLSEDKFALDDLVVLQTSSGLWFRPRVGETRPQARAFHSACVVGQKVYMFGGHVWVKERKGLQKFNDLWCLNTATWEWTTVDLAKGSPQPSMRDFAVLVDLEGDRLLLHGGLDATEKRLDDIWLFDLGTYQWTEWKIPGPRPKARYAHAAARIEQRLLLFGGESNSGLCGDLWALRGIAPGGEEPASWVPLELPGSPPMSRKGHALAKVGLWLVVMGGRTAEIGWFRTKTDLFHNDVVVMERSTSVAWKTPPLQTAAPPAREFHSLTALSSGALLLFGGGNGKVIFSDVWLLEVEEEMRAAMAAQTIDGTKQPPTPGGGRQPATPSSAGGGGSTTPLSMLSDAADNLAGLLARPRNFFSGAAGRAGTAGGAGLGSVDGDTPSEGSKSKPTTPLPLKSKPASSSAAAARRQSSTGATIAAVQPGELANLGGLLSRSARRGDAEMSNAGPSHEGSGATWEGLVREVEEAVPAELRTAWQRGDEAPNLETSTSETHADSLEAFREYFMHHTAQEVRLKEVAPLLADYRALVSAALRRSTAGLDPAALLNRHLSLRPDQLLPPGCSGRFLHLSAEAARLSDLDPLLAEYRTLVTQHRGSELEHSRGQEAARVAGDEAALETPLEYVSTSRAEGEGADGAAGLGNAFGSLLEEPRGGLRQPQAGQGTAAAGKEARGSSLEEAIESSSEATAAEASAPAIDYLDLLSSEAPAEVPTELPDASLGSAAAHAEGAPAGGIEPGGSPQLGESGAGERDLLLPDEELGSRAESPLATDREASEAPLTSSEMFTVESLAEAATEGGPAAQSSEETANLMDLEVDWDAPASLVPGMGARDTAGMGLDSEGIGSDAAGKGLDSEVTSLEAAGDAGARPVAGGEGGYAALLDLVGRQPETASDDAAAVGSGPGDAAPPGVSTEAVLGGLAAGDLGGASGATMPGASAATEALPALADGQEHTGSDSLEPAVEGKAAPQNSRLEEGAGAPRAETEASGDAAVQS